MTQVEDNLFHKLKSTFLRILGLRSYSAISNVNTKTIYLYVVVKVVDCNSKKHGKHLLRWYALLLLNCNMWLVYVIGEASWLTCFSMSDCSLGKYCGMHYKDHSTCVDCPIFIIKHNVMKICVLHSWETGI